MTVVLDPRVHAAAAKAAIDAAVGPDPATSLTRVFDYDDVPGTNKNPGTPPNIHVLISLERRYNPNLRSAKAGAAGWRLAARGIGRTVDESRWALLMVATALNEKRLFIGEDEIPTTPIQYESGQAPELDDGMYAGLDFYTYASH